MTSAGVSAPASCLKPQGRDGDFQYFYARLLSLSKSLFQWECLGLMNAHRPQKRDSCHRHVSPNSIVCGGLCRICLQIPWGVPELLGLFVQKDLFETSVGVFLSVETNESCLNSCFESMFQLGIPGGGGDALSYCSSSSAGGFPQVREKGSMYTCFCLPSPFREHSFDSSPCFRACSCTWHVINQC